MAACPACTFINADDANACEMCGASLETTLPAAAAVKACAHCTLENAADASACVACGAWWCPRCTRCVPAAVACCDVCGYPESADNDAAAAEAVADAADAAAAAPPAPITPEDVANKDYRPRRVERALAAMPLDALERIVDEPARFVALACGEQPPAARPVGRVADPEPGEPAACTCPDGAPGERRCLATGAGYASCTCPPPSGDVEPGPQRAVRTNEEVETNGADDVGEPPASEDSTAGDSTAGDTAPEDTSAEDTAAAETPPTSPDEASAPGGAPTVFTRISFDLRGMPHRGPHDVDPARIDGRRPWSSEAQSGFRGRVRFRVEYGVRGGVDRRHRCQGRLPRSSRPERGVYSSRIQRFSRI